MLKMLIDLFMKPKSLDTLTPMHEVYDTFKGRKKDVIGMIVGSILGGIFVSGLIYQLYMTLLRKQRYIALFSCFKYGITKTWVITIILSLLLMYGNFRLFRALKKNYRKNFKDNYLRSDKETYGGAHFQEEDELKDNFNIVKDINETTDEVFGTDDKKNIYAFSYPAGMNRNKIFFGAPGSGKSAAIIKTDMYQAARRGESIVATDSKGDLYKETSAVFRQMGYIVRVFNLKSKEFKNSDGFNIMKNLKKDDPELDARAAVVANIIIKNTEAAEGMDYWAKNEYNLLKAIIMYLATEDAYIRANKNNLPEVFRFVGSNGPKEMQAIFANIKKENPVRKAYDIFANCSEQNQGQIINGLAIRLTVLTNPYLQEVLSNDEIDLTLPMKRKCIYYIVISDTDDTYHFLASLFFNSIFIEQCDYSDSLTPEQKIKQLSVNYELDEYRNIGGIQTLPIQIATVRSRKMALTIIVQDKGQLNTVHSEDEAATILNCCTVKGLLSTNDVVTAQYFSTLLGTFTVLVENEKINEGSENVVHMRGTVQKTMGEGKRELMTPDELMNGKLGRDELIYVIAAMPPVRLKKYFSEKAGEAIHPLEIKGRELGYKMPNRHKPKWRKAKEDALAAQNNSSSVPSSSAPSAPKTTTSNTVASVYTAEASNHNPYKQEIKAENGNTEQPVKNDSNPYKPVSGTVNTPKTEDNTPIAEQEIQAQPTQDTKSTQKAPYRPQITRETDLDEVQSQNSKKSNSEVL